MELERKQVSPQLKEVLNFVSSENGVRAVDVALKLGMKQSNASSALATLRHQGKVYSKRLDGLNAHRWFATKADIPWIVRNTGPQFYYTNT